MPKRAAADRTEAKYRSIPAPIIVLALAAIAVAAARRHGNRKYAQGYIDAVQYCHTNRAPESGARSRV
ncbi:hypothetical protein Apa02nite_068130 [Actinoplanes palleronii]|uniref:Secreted protein n=1 Tax=Actinoplanes palleronii TaxID=113570 RepID=A0ABQ4BKC8_9ACTN|nr:hypothetical protein Apa02nite_068130 [Actinoplanes palleronii]